MSRNELRSKKKKNYAISRHTVKARNWRRKLPLLASEKVKENLSTNYICMHRKPVIRPFFLKQRNSIWYASYVALSHSLLASRKRVRKRSGPRARRSRISESHYERVEREAVKLYSQSARAIYLSISSFYGHSVRTHAYRLRESRKV